MQAVLMLGGNQGRREEILQEALDRLAAEAGRLTALSSLYETEPWGFSAGQDFLNRAAVLETSLTPEGLLAVCQKTEKALGRRRHAGGPRYTSRPIDIDILFYGEERISTPDLEIPHPRIAERGFVLIPLAEIMPGFVHPGCGRTVRELLQDCPDRLAVRKYTPSVSRNA